MTFGTHKVCHLVDPAAPARAGRSTWSTSGSTCPSRRSRRSSPRTSRRCCRRRARTRRSTPAAWSASARAARSTPAPPCSPSPARAAGWPAWSGTSARRPSRPRSARHHPEVVGAGRVQAWVVGSGRRRARGRRAAGRARGRRPGRGRRRCAGARRPGRARPACSPPTPASSPRCSATTGPRSRRRPLNFARHAAATYDSVVLLKGRRTVVARPDGRVRVNTTGTPWLATAGAGDVLGGLIGSLLASGLSPYDAASVGAWLHGAAATLPLGGPLVAGEVRGHPGGGPGLPDRVVRGLPGMSRATAPRSSSTSPPSATTSARSSAHAGTAFMAVVKADGYGHGLVEVARAAREAGADWLGVATIDEALALRAGGDTGRVLCWLTVPGDDWAPRPSTADIDVTAYSVAELDAIAATAPAAGAPPACSSRSTPASTAAAPRHAWSEVVAAPARGERRASGASPASGRTSPAATSPTTRPTTRRSSSSARRSASPRPPGSAPRSATSPTPPPRSCAPAPTSTWSAAASRRTASTRRPAAPPASACDPP